MRDVPYRSSHRGAGKAADYDRDFWRPGTIKAQNWELERELLARVFDGVLRSPPQRALDFACGTGRVLSELEARVPQTFGIDISAEMLEIARTRCTRSQLVCADVTRSSPTGLDLGGPVDLVTSFRFFLNAEPALRRDALAWIRAQLSGEGRLVANFHLNPNSLRGSYLRARWKGRRLVAMLSPREFENLLADAGFVIEDVRGYEYLPYRREGAHPRAPKMRNRIEHALLRVPGLRPLAGCHLVVARAT